MEEWEHLEGHKDLYKVYSHSIPCFQLEENKTHMTERIIHLALEIICLVTGESFPPVKSGDHVTIKVSAPPSLTPERNKERKILEVTKKIIELLTGEVEHLLNVKVEVTEREEEVYMRTDVQCKEEKVPKDGSSNRKPPERCPRPLHSKQDDHTIPHRDQGEDLKKLKAEGVKEDEDEEVYMVVEKPVPPKMSTDGSSNRIIQEKHPRSLYSQQSTQEGCCIPHHYQENNAEDFQVVVIKEEKEENVAFPALTRQEEEIPAEIGTDGHYVRKSAERYLSSLQNQASRNSAGIVSPDSPENFLYTSDINLGLYIADISPDSGKSSGGYRGDRLYRCTECDKSFCQNAALVRHQRNHTGEKPFQCMECGKSFTRKSILVEHRRIHTGEKPFSCLECGKCFTQRSGLLIHRKTHRGPMKFPCSGCGHFFTPTVNTDTGQIETFCASCRKSNLPPPLSPELSICDTEEDLILGQESNKNCLQESKPPSQPKVPMGEKRYTCPECQKSFTRKSILVEHQRIHTGEKPFSCSQCWKSFTQRSGLVIHRRIHAREKIYSCSECRCIFTQKANALVGEESSCPDCRKESTQKP